MLTAEQAAEVALRHGLGLADAASLRALADDEQSADRIAARFATSDAASDGQLSEEQRFTRALFARAD